MGTRKNFNICVEKKLYVYRMSQEECARLREGVPCVKLCRYNPKHTPKSMYEIKRSIRNARSYDKTWNTNVT
jgi:hypothetical protein